MNQPRDRGGTQTEILVRREQLDGITAEWRALAESRGNGFVSPEWFFAWMSHYGSRAKPAVTVTRAADGSLVGLLPLVQERVGPVRAARFAGDNLGDLFHPVAALEDELEVAAAGCAALAAGLGGSALVFRHVPASANWPEQGLRSGYSPAASYRRGVLPFIDLDGLSWDQYLGARSRNFRSQVRRKMRGLDRGGEVRFRLTADESEVAADVETLFRLHDERWSGRGGSSSSTERSRAFHREFATAALAAGWLRLWSLEVDGEPVAAWYGWRLGDRYSYYQAGFSSRWADRSVGFVLLAHTIRAAIEEGACEYDLLLGEDEYKSRFATGERRVETMVASRGAAAAVAKLEGALWRTRDRLAPSTQDRVTRVYLRLPRLARAQRR